jgi:hypothetical protein
MSGCKGYNKNRLWLGAKGKLLAIENLAGVSDVGTERKVNMKKTVVAIMFFVMMCSLAYGDILVHKFTGQYKPYIGFTDSSYSTARVSAPNITGYSVSDIDRATGALIGAPTLIFYDSKAKWYYPIDANENLTDYYGFSIEGTSDWGIYAYVVLNDSASFWYFSLYGKCATVDIGRIDRSKALTPRTMSGVMLASYGGTTPINAFGNITMTLDLKYTQSANRMEATQAATVNAIITDLQGKGYKPR